MSKKKYWLSAAALAASSIQASASVPQTTSPVERPAPPVVAGVTGLTAADLIVGRDGTVAVDLKTRGVTVASCSNTGNNGAACNGSGSC
ncbi:MAG: hypothetical protein ACLPGW_11705 [Roseiarcus sp.]